MCILQVLQDISLSGLRSCIKKLFFLLFCLDVEHCVLLIGKDINFECLEAV